MIKTILRGIQLIHHNLEISTSDSLKDNMDSPIHVWDNLSLCQGLNVIAKQFADTEKPMPLFQVPRTLICQK